LGARFGSPAENGSDSMSTSIHAAEQRKLRSIARQYQRNGYRVTIPRQGESLPTFLEGFTPDLIAESEKDHVVIEIKSSDAVRGSNDLMKVAERVSRQPGWRFELVTISPIERVSVPTPKRMDFIEERAHRASKIGLTDLAYAYAYMALEQILSDLALQHGLNAGRLSITQSSRDLVSRGIISREALDALEQARIDRNRLMHADIEFRPSAADVEKLLVLGQSLRDEMAATAPG
jgi:hypothetical protein